MNQLFSAVTKMVLYQICNECRKKYFTFKAQFLGSLSGLLAAASSPVGLGWVTVWSRDQKVKFN